MRKLYLIVLCLALIAAAALTAVPALATKPKHPKPPPPVATPTPAPKNCVPTGAGKDGQPGNDDCAPLTTPSSSPAPVTSPAPVARCPKGMTKIGQQANILLCAKTVTKTVTKIKRKTVFKQFCPKPRQAEKLTG